jgi:peroxiredoxin
MRKTWLFVCVASVAFFGCDTTKRDDNGGFTINAEIRGTAENTLISLHAVKDGQLTQLDSQYLDNSKVSFEGVLDQPDMVYLKIGDSRKAINIFAENSNITASANVDSLDRAVITGSSVHDDLLEFTRTMKIFDEKYASLNQAYRLAVGASDAKKMEEILAEYDHSRLEQFEMIKKFVANKSDSYISPFITKHYLSMDMEVSELEKVLAGMDSSIHDSRDYISMYDGVEKLRRVDVGRPAVDFALNDTTGNPISISSFRGKYLLIDFWASWCGPCRKENPFVVELYNDFNDKGFEIIGVSLDEDRSRWVKAIHDDMLTWSHVSDLKGWASEAGSLYSIKSIPATVLLDREGIIIEKNLRGDALRKKLEEIFAKEMQNS